MLPLVVWLLVFAGPSIGSMPPLPTIVETALKKYIDEQPVSLPIRLFCSERFIGNYTGNLRIDSTGYSNVTYRDLDDTLPLFGPELREFIDGIPKNGVTILPGGAFSIVGIQMAQMGHHVIALSAEQFYKRNLWLLTLPDFLRIAINDAFQNPKRELEHFGVLPVHVLNRLALALGVPVPNIIKNAVPVRTHPLSPEKWIIPPPTDEDTAIAEISQFVAKLLLKVYQPKLGTLLLKDQVDAHEFLAGLPGLHHQIAMILDVYDAMAYVSLRLDLLGLYHLSLEVGARAYVEAKTIFDFVRLTRRESIEKFQDLIIKRGENVVFLIEYLTRMYPTLFRQYPNLVTVTYGPRMQAKEEHTILVVEKPERTDIRRMLQERLARDNLGVWGAR